MRKHRRLVFTAAIIKLKQLILRAEWESVDSPCNGDMPALPEMTSVHVDLTPKKVNAIKSSKSNTAA